MPFGANDEVLFGAGDEVLDAPLEGELLPASGPRGRRYTPTRSQQQQNLSNRYLASANAEAGARAGILDMAATGVVNTIPTVLNSAANIASAFPGRIGNFLGIKNDIEADTRDPSRSFATMPLQTQEGRDMAASVGRLLPEWMRNMDPLVMDAVNVAGAAAPLPKVNPLSATQPAAAGARLLSAESLNPLAARTAATAASEGAIRAAGSVAPQARAAGFDVTPSAVGVSRSEALKGAAADLEGPKRAPEASLRNARQANRRLGDELGVQVDADGRLTEAAFNDARQPAFALYDEAKNLPGGPSDEYSTAVLRAIQRVDVPTEGANEVARLMQKYNQVGDSAQLVEDLKNLRRTASKRREGDVANQVANEALADVQMAIADELENELGRRATAAGDAGFQERLQQARLHLAQLYETERATTGGYVDAAQLAARQKKTGKLTGNLALIASMRENLPQVFQHPQTAVPGAQGHIPEAWGARSLMFRMGERLLGGKLSRNAMEAFNENIPFGPNALDEFGIVPVRERGYPSPMGPNAGPQPAVPPPSAPPGLFAQTLPGPTTPNMPSAGRPAPTGPSFNTMLADELLQQMPEAFPGPGIYGPNMPINRNVAPIEPWKRDLTVVGGGAIDARDLALEGDLPPVPPARAPGARPLDSIDFERGPAPGEPQTAVRDALSQDELRMAAPPWGVTDMATGLQEPGLPISALLGGDIVSRRAGNLGRGIEGGFAAQLGPGNFEAGINAFENAPLPAMPDRPRGVAGPRSAQLSDPRVPGFGLLPDTGPLPPPGPRFGPGDEFPGAAAPVLSQGPVPEGPASAAMDANPAFQRAVDNLTQQAFADALLEGRPDLIGPAPGSFAAAMEELALLPDNGPASPRVDVTETAPGAATGLFPDQYLVPGAQRMEGPGGLIDYIPGELDWRITNQFVPEGARGQGNATANVVELARRAQSEGFPLHSDTSVTDAIARLMLGARERGQLNFDEANALRMQQLLQEGQPVLRSSVPWFQNIRPGP